MHSDKDSDAIRRLDIVHALFNDDNADGIHHVHESQGPDDESSLLVPGADVLAIADHVPEGFTQQADTSGGFIPSVEAVEVSDEDLASKRLILFVDDIPENNYREIAYFKKRGYKVISTTSTSSALTLLEHGVRPDLVVSDMGRNEDSEANLNPTTFAYNRTAGLLLLREIHTKFPHFRQTPFVIYTTFDNIDRYRLELESLTPNQNGKIVSSAKALAEAVEMLIPVVQVVEVGESVVDQQNT